MMKQKKPTAHDAAMKAIVHTTASDLEAAVADAIDVIDTIGINAGIYSLVAIAYIAGTAAGKHADRQRKQLPSVHRWPFVETKRGRDLFRQCNENGNFKPYHRERARYDLEFDRIAGIKPPKRRVDRPDPADTYSEVVSRDIPRLSDTISAIQQNLARILSATLRASILATESTDSRLTRAFSSSSL